RPLSLLVDRARQVPAGIGHHLRQLLAELPHELPAGGRDLRADICGGSGTLAEAAARLLRRSADALAMRFELLQDSRGPCRRLRPEEQRGSDAEYDADGECRHEVDRVTLRHRNL